MKIVKRIMLVLLSLVLLLVVATVIFFKTAPQIGGKAKGERLERMQQAPNYEDGIFVNTIETKLAFDFSTFKKTISHYLFADKRLKSPQKPISVQPFDKVAFESIPDDSIAFVWFGHSTILMKVQGVTLLLDPILVGKRASMFPFMGPMRFAYSEHISIDKLPEIDAMLLSHDHYDHLDYKTIIALKDLVKHFYIPLGVGAHFERWGIASDKMTELNWWDEVDLQELKLAFAPTRHFSGRGLNDQFKTLWGSWVIHGSNKRLYFSGDSGYFPGFKEIGERYGPFDLTFMECGAYNESWSEIHMFPEQTAQAHVDVQGKLLMPIHWGKFDLALHPWKESVDRLNKKADELNLSLFTPEVGQLVSLADSSSVSNWWEQVN